MLLGTEIGAALTALEPFDIDVIGLNCATGPKEMNDAVRYLGLNCTKHISVLPNAGLPHNEGGRAVYKLRPEELAEYHKHFVADYGVRIVGGCCGTTPWSCRWAGPPPRTLAGSSAPVARTQGVVGARRVEATRRAVQPTVGLHRRQGPARRGTGASTCRRPFASIRHVAVGAVREGGQTREGGRPHRTIYRGSTFSAYVWTAIFPSCTTNVSVPKTMSTVAHRACQTM